MIGEAGVGGRRGVGGRTAAGPEDQHFAVKRAASLKEGQEVLVAAITPYPGPRFPRDGGVMQEFGGRTWGALRGSKLKE